MQRDERGQVVPLLAALVVLVGLLGLALVRVGVDAIDAARAQTAADAAALAAAVAPSSEQLGVAERIGGQNGASSVTLRRVGTDVVVTARVGHATARARGHPESEAATNPGVHCSLCQSSPRPPSTRPTARPRGQTPPPR